MDAIGGTNYWAQVFWASCLQNQDRAKSMVMEYTCTWLTCKSASPWEWDLNAICVVRRVLLKAAADPLWKAPENSVGLWAFVLLNYNLSLCEIKLNLPLLPKLIPFLFLIPNLSNTVGINIFIALRHVFCFVASASCGVTLGGQPWLCIW